MMKERLLLIPLIILQIAFFSCSVPTDQEWYSRNSELSELHPTVIQSSEMFSKTNSATGDAQWHLKTNDRQYLKPGGYLAWDITSSQNSTEATAIRAIKQSGSPSAGYGLVYFYRTSQGHEYMILAMINVMQQYTVGKYSDGNYTEIISWTHSSLLHRGFGSTNSIELSYNTSSRVFTLKLNNSTADTFEDASTPRLTTGRKGLVACISQLEDFDFSCVDVLFEEM